MIVMEAQYFPPISSMMLMANYKEIFFDGYEHYVKGTYRNRCYICGANGKLRLSVPLEKGKHQRRALKDVAISYEHDWQKLHWQSFCSAYRRSPYFEYYEDEFYSIFHEKKTLLLELNTYLLQWINNAMELGLTFSYTQSYVAKYDEKHRDYRNLILPNKTTESFVNLTAYQQVYGNKMDFIPNLSVLDVLFNLGPKKGRAYLMENLG